MSRRGASLLQSHYGLPADKIDHIPHGIPDLPFLESAPYKRRLHLSEHQVLLTFGLLVPNKGIENVIKALPQIAARHPHVLYLVVGEMHPVERRRDGEGYRRSLLGLARSLGVEAHVRFHDHFVTAPELRDFVGAADVCLTPLPRSRLSHLGAAQLRRRRRQGDHLHTLFVRGGTPGRRRRRSRPLPGPGRHRRPHHPTACQ